MLQTKGLVVVLQDAQSVALAKKARTDEDTHVTLDLWCLTRVTVWPEMPGLTADCWPQYTRHCGVQADEERQLPRGEGLAAPRLPQAQQQPTGEW